ncbi:hypothetical protein [Corynebacterium glyciniphilum]|uniref:hypothetical protein n=1 Tax=Corynebacterium glyciniphilum TaxID=1404244 RepID=UPI0016425939|nr:hypothetical protein [Corynebacterium glyciniphilum]
MAGYNWGAGKSNNAVGAEARGLATATETAKAAREAGHRGVTSAFINESAPTTGEWHHTSKMFNRTYYYDPEEIIEWLGTVEGAAALTRFKTEAKKAHGGRTTTGTVAWVEFEGSGRSKRGVEHRWSGEVVLKGKSIYFDGQRKLLTGNYITFVEDGHGVGGENEAVASESIPESAWEPVTGTFIGGDEQITGEFMVAGMESVRSRVEPEDAVIRLDGREVRCDGNLIEHSLDESEWELKTGTAFYSVWEGARRRERNFTGTFKFSGDAVRYEDGEIRRSNSIFLLEHPLDSWVATEAVVVRQMYDGDRELYSGLVETVEGASGGQTRQLARFDGQVYDCDAYGLKVTEKEDRVA